MTTSDEIRIREAERTFRKALYIVIENARDSDVEGGRIAADLRSIAYEVAEQWRNELNRRNAQRIAEMNVAAAAE